MQGRIQRFWIRGPLYTGHHVCPTKKISGFIWSKNAKITLETISFCQNIFFSIFKVFRFLYTMKTCRWNLINFPKFSNPFTRKKKKHSYSSQWEKNWEKLEFFITGCFIKPFKMIINQIFFNWSFRSQDLFYLLQWKPFKNDDKCFFVLKIFKVLSWSFCRVEKRLD